MFYLPSIGTELNKIVLLTKELERLKRENFSLRKQQEDEKRDERRADEHNLHPQSQRR